MKNIFAIFVRTALYDDIVRFERAFAKIDGGTSVIMFRGVEVEPRMCGKYMKSDDPKVLRDLKKFYAVPVGSENSPEVLKLVEQYPKYVLKH